MRIAPRQCIIYFLWHPHGPQCQQWPASSAASASLRATLFLLHLALAGLLNLSGAVACRGIKGRLGLIRGHSVVREKVGEKKANSVFTGQGTMFC
jgi:hypothetical protein